MLINFNNLQQVWEMVAKLHHKELELQAKQSTAIIQDQPGTHHALNKKYNFLV